MVLSLIWSASLLAGLSDKTFDPLFKAYSEKYLPYDWHWTKAQAWQESRFDPRARSPVGAQGLMQIMPATAAEIAQRTGIEGPINNPRINVLYGTYYMSRMMAIWITKRSQQERKLLATASYNAGAGNIISAQKKCGNELLWQAIKPCLSIVTGRHSKETISYVERIEVWYEQITTALNPIFCKRFRS